MKKLAIALTLALALSGCANLAPLTRFVTVGVSNPVTPAMVYQAENAMIVTVSGLLAYKNACIAKTIAQSCRDTIQKLQVYTRPAAKAIKDLRAALRANDQIKAVTAYNTFIQLMDDFKTTAIASGVH